MASRSGACFQLRVPWVIQPSPIHPEWTNSVLTHLAGQYGGNNSMQDAWQYRQTVGKIKLNEISDVYFASIWSTWHFQNKQR